MDSKNAVRVLIAICIVAFIMRLCLFVFTIQQHAIELFEFENVATNMLQGNGFILNYLGTVYKAGIAPLYPFICFFLYFLFGHHYLWVVLLQIILAIMICYVVFKIATLLYDFKAGLWAAALVAFHPGLLVYSSMKLHSLMLYSFFICTIVLKHIEITRDDSLRNRLALTLLWGLCILERPTVLAFLLPVLVWHYVVTRNKESALSMALTVCVGIFIITFPWLIRNYTIYKQVIFIQSNQWQGLWVGNNPLASGTLYLPDGKNMLEANPEMLRQLSGLDEKGQINLFKSEARKFIKDNPARFFMLAARKFYYFWWFSPQSGILYSRVWLSIYKIYYCTLAFFAAIGSACLLRDPWLRKFLILIFLLFFSYSFLHSFYYAEGRHRWSIEPLIIVFSSVGICSMWDRLMRRYRQRTHAEA